MRTALALVVLGLGCGNDTIHHLTDGGGDAAPDAPAIDAMRDAAPDAPDVGLVTVSYSLFDDPAQGSGRTVYFLDAQSNVVLETTTDATGSASAMMTAGGSVSIVETDEDLRRARRPARRAHPADAAPPFLGELFTILDVTPGDHIVVDGFPGEPAHHDAITFDLTVPAFAGAASIQAQTSCGAGSVTGGSATSITLQLCGGAADFLIVALDANGAPLGSIFAPGVTVADGLAVDLTGAYEAPLTAAMAITGLPAATSSVALTEQLTGPRGGDQFANLLFAAGASPSITGLTATGSAVIPTSATAGLTQVETIDIAQAALDNQRVVQWGAPTASYAVDVSPLLLADVATAPVGSDDQTLRWTPAAGGAEPDATVAIVRTTNSSGRWYVVAPGGGSGVVQLPHLPSDEFDLTIGSDATFEQFETMSITGGYAAAKAAHPWADIDVGHPAPVMTGSGTATFAVAVGL